jgi:uncharacterized FAD-dependent dehydrogenase
LLEDLTVVKRGLDARPRNPRPVFVLTVDAVLKLDRLPRKVSRRHVSTFEREKTVNLGFRPLESPPKVRPIVIGAGPAGLMATYILAEAGAAPILIERGEPASERSERVTRFWRDGTLNPESNALYGEGGAGLFSDGKLTSRSKDRRRALRFMEVLVSCGAPEDILIDSDPHVGSDKLIALMPVLREKLTEMGADIRFNARLDGFETEDGRLAEVIVNGERIPCRQCIVATGHSARDVYQLLLDGGAELEPKSFAIGVRIEVPQPLIDTARFGSFAGHPRLGAASFRLTRRAEKKARPCYSFCMCPGGRVIACASEPGMMTTNGMSYSRRNMPMGNAAFLVPVSVDDFDPVGDPRLGGIDLQREIERKAFLVGGGDYAVPAVRLNDFLVGKTSTSFPDTISCPRLKPADFHDILPEYVTETLVRSVPKMFTELNAIDTRDAVMYAAETRSSSPVRVVRNDHGESTTVAGLFPAGEGAGYAGGIVSSGIDGIRAAENCLEVIVGRRNGES